MDTREVVDKYYEYANANDWDRWCNLFDESYKMDEQLLGPVQGLDNLRNIMAGFPNTFSRFENRPKHIVVNGDEAAVVSHISAASAKEQPIEAEVCNYFRVQDGKIVYMANFHDTKPFAPIMGG